MFCNVVLKKECLGFECLVVLLLWIFSGLNRKFSRGQYLLGFYRTLLEGAYILVKRGRCRKEEDNRGEGLRCCAFLGRYLDKFFRAILPRGCMFERNEGVYLEVRLVLERTHCD